ncbi:MAG: DVUA0089 family protein [Planctomycetaceae bacterium]
MLISSWLKSLVKSLPNQPVRGQHRRRSLTKTSPQAAVPQASEALETRVLLSAPSLVKVASTNSGRFLNTDIGNPDTLNVAPEQLTLTFNPGQVIDVASAQSAITVTNSAGEPVNIGHIGRGATPEEIVVRFAETLPDDSYSLNISATLTNAAGEPFRDSDGDGTGQSQSVLFNLDLGAQVVAVVPQPVTNSGGVISQARDQIVVYFNDDDLDPVQAQDPAFYQLINADPNASPADPFTPGATQPNGMVRLPASVVYDDVADTATLTFSSAIEDLFPGGTSLFRLQVGTNVVAPTPTAHQVDISASASTTFGFDQDVDGDGVNEFVDLTFHLADAPVGTTQEGKSVRISITVNPAATSRLPVVTAIAATGQIDVVVSSAVGFETRLSDLLSALAADSDVTSLIRAEVAPNSNLLAPIGSTIAPTGERYTLFDPGSSFRTAGDATTDPGSVSPIGTLTPGGVQITAAIEPQYFPFDFPGSYDEPGQREIEIFRFTPSFDTRVNPAFVDEPTLTQDALDQFPYDFIDPGLLNGPGAETLFYNFQQFVGFTPEGLERTNTITENMKQRVREVFEFYSFYLGVQFVETANRGFTIARSDMRILNSALFNGANDGVVGIADPSAQLAILDSTENWNDTFADYTDPQNLGTVNFFEEAMEVVGLLLGLGNSDHLPDRTVQGEDNVFFTTANSNLVELDFPGDLDIVAGRVVHPADSKDIDLYPFTLPEDGLFTAEIFAERLTGDDTSLLDSMLRLYQVTPSGNVLIAQNDDYFSEDSLIELNLEAGDYFIGVSASGNDNYNPTIADTGLNGRTHGKYQLNLNFKENLGVGTFLADATGVALDGDHDGVEGGVHNFWFRAVATPNTFFVNRTEVIASGFYNIATDPSIAGARVYNEIDRALADAVPGTIVRIVGNELDRAFEIGLSGAVLRDGRNLQVPKGVGVMIDAGAILKLRSSRISVGSFDLVTDRSEGSLQILGTPQQQVVITSWLNEGIGGDTTSTPTTPSRGDWGGIVFQEDLDRSVSGRTVFSDDGVFLNYVAFAEMTYGGGRLDIGSVNQTINPIHTIEARPTILHNTIVLSNDSALSADPNSFRESRFAEYNRIGPDIYGNILAESTDNLRAVSTVDASGNPVVVQNTANGLFIRVLTPAGTSQKALTVAGRFDDRDIVHILTQNLKIEGTPGGRLDALVAPELDRGLPSPTTLTSVGVGDLKEGTYSYRMTFVSRDGSGNVILEGPPSDPSDSIFITGDPTTGSAIRLTSLPTATGTYNGRRLYRSHDGVVYTLVAELNASTTTFTDDEMASGEALDTRSYHQSTARYDASLVIDPGIILKMEDAAIEVGIGAQLIAEGEAGREIIFTSRKDDSFGAGGTFDTNNDAVVPGAPAAAPGDWGGLFIGHLSSASISDALITFGGGSASVQGGFASFNAVEIHQARARIVNTILENNADGTEVTTPEHRFGRGSNGEAVIFVRGAQPVIADNIIRNNSALAFSINANALNHELVADWGRSRGEAIRIPGHLDNQGPLIDGNVLDGNFINGLHVRGEVLTTQGVWDDTSIVHVLLNDEIIIPDVTTFGGLRMESSADQSLVVKLLGSNAGFTAIGRPLDITDRIGGTLHIVGQPGKPVVLTSLHDDSVGAGFNQAGLPQNDTNGNGAASSPSPGDWRAITLDQFSNDRNVGIYVEGESPRSSAPGSNAIADSAEFLGQLAPLEDVANAGDLAPLTGPSQPLRGGGDETLRLGFEVHGVLNEINDIDVYSFTATAGSEIWIDIDRSRHVLDSIVELIDVDGNILASSDNTIDEQTQVYDVYQQPGAVSVGLKANTLNKSIHESDDFFTTNQRDAGMRVVLPGARGDRGTFLVRVRSSNIDSLNPAAARADLLDNSKLSGGKTAGAYQMQIRLREKDEVPGSTVRYADIRFANNGIEILGQPTHSPLLGEFSEDPNGDVSNTFGGAANVGNLLNTDKGAISVSANLSREDDIDWYRFDVRYDSVRDDELSIIDGHVSLIFDMDFADDVGGPNTRLSVFDATGRLILLGENSNIADDRPAGNETEGDTDDKSRGSVGVQDPFIGPVELPVGTYYMAVTSIAQLPSALAQYVTRGGTPAVGLGDDLFDVRLEPVNSIRKIAEERFDSIEPFLGVDQTTADAPIVDLFDQSVLLDTNGGFFGSGTDEHRVPFELSDVTLFVSHGFGLEGDSDRAIATIDPFTGILETSVGPEVGGQQPIGDVAMRPDGQLMAFSIGPSSGQLNDANADDYFVIDSGNGTRQNIGNASGDHGIQTWFVDNMGNDAQQNTGLRVEALAYSGLGDNSGVFVARRGAPGSSTRPNPIDQNIVFTFDIRNGSAQGVNNSRNIMDNGPRVTSDAGLSHLPTGWIDTSVGLGGRVTGIDFDSRTGTWYAIDNAGGLYTFNPNSRNSASTNFIADIGAANGLGSLNFQGLAFGPDDIRRDPNTGIGRYENTLFAITQTGQMFAFDTMGVPDPVFVDGRTFISTQSQFGTSNVTGLAFGTLDRNLWNVTSRRAGDDGVGPETPIDLSRDLTDDGIDQGSALYFGPSISDQGTYGNKDERGTANGIADERNLDFPGGAQGTIVSREFDLSPYTSADKPFFSFNYYLQTENIDALWSDQTPQDNQPMVDSFRVFVGGDDGNWNLVATNNSLQRLQTDNAIDEFDYAPTDPSNPLDVQAPITSTGNITSFPLTQNFPDVVELYDDTTGFAPGSPKQWRNAYIDLSNYAGQSNLKLRFDFSTAGGMDFADGSFQFGGSGLDVLNGDRAEDLLALPASELRDGERFEMDGDGNFTDIDAFNAGITTVPPVGDHFEFDYGFVIQSSSGNAIVGGQTLVVEGTTFTFEKVSPLTSANPIPIGNTQTSGQVAQAIADAVNAAGLTNTSTGNAIFAIVVGNRINFVNASTLDTTGTPTLTQSSAPEYGEPGVRAGHVEVPINLGMTRAEVALAIKAAMAETHFANTSFFTGTSEHRIAEDAAPNDTFATAFDVDLGPWGTSFDADVDNGTGNSTIIPHLSINGSGDGTIDRYRFTGTAGSAVTLDIDGTNGWDTFLTLYRDNGGTPIVVTSDDDSFLDSGSTSGLDSLIQIILPVDDIYYVEVSSFPGGVPIAGGDNYRLHLSVENHPELAAFPTTDEVETNNTLVTAQSLDGELWAPISNPEVNSGAIGAIDISTTAPYTTVRGNLAAGDRDFYSFTVTDGDVINFDLDNDIAGGGFFLLNLYDASGTPVAGFNETSGTFFGGATYRSDNPTTVGGNATPGIQRTVVTSVLGATEVWTVEVVGFLGSPGIGDYRLHVSVPTQPDSSALLAQIPSLGTGATPVTLTADPLNIPGDHTKGMIKVVGHSVTNPGLLGHSDTLPGDEFGAFGVSAGTASNRSRGALRGVANRIEGVWVDDIIIGVAERGHMVINAPVNTGFSIDERLYGPTFFANGDVDRDQRNVFGSPNNTEILKGAYTLEVRRAAEFGISVEPLPVTNRLFRAFDDTDRLTEALTLFTRTVDQVADGNTFTLTDGIDRLTFEYEDINVGNGVTPGHVAIPIDPILDGPDSRSDEVIARTIAAVINGTDVQPFLDISATAVGNRVELFGEVNQIIEVEAGQGVVGFIAPNVSSTHQIAPESGTSRLASSQERFDTFQFENTSGENIVRIDIELPEGQFFDLRDTFGVGLSLFEGADPAINPNSSLVGATFNFVEGAQTGFVTFTNFEHGEKFLFNVGVSHFIDEDLLSTAATGVSTGLDLVNSTITTFFDSDSSGTFTPTDRFVQGRMMPGEFFEHPYNQYAGVLAFDFIDATIYDEFGDSNTEREQGQIVIESNTISDSANFAITSNPGESNLNNHRLGNFAPGAGLLPGIGANRSTVELNDLGLVPGVVIQNNALVRSGTGGIDFAGDPNGVAPFGRIVNNTILGGTVQSGGGNSVTFDGIVFPNGLSSFADRVVQYAPVGGNILRSNDPTDSLDIPDEPGLPIPPLGTVVSLGDGGFIVLEFSDNILVPSGDSTPDLHIFEAGGVIEFMQVEISEDGVTWLDVGTISGQPSSIDIDAAAGINMAGMYRFVRITDDLADGGGPPQFAGAEIDAVGAISSIPLVGSGVGIRVRDNASPSILNNALAQLNTGITLDGPSAAAGTVIGANFYVDNVNDHGGVATYGTFDASDKQAVNPDWSVGNVFVDVSVTNLYPAPGSPLIDSSLDTLDERTEVTTVRDPLGIARSPILAPQLDLFGQTRADDDLPGTGPGAPGANVRKDRGAIDRVDFDGPTSSLLVIDSRIEGDITIQDEDQRTDSLGNLIVSESDSSFGEIDNLTLGEAQAVRQFVLRFSDIGVGIDDAPILAAVNDTTGTIGLPFTLQQDGVDLVEGVDYLFVWNSNTDEAIFRAVTEFPLEHFYTILVDNDPAFGARSDLPSGAVDPHPNDGVTGVRDLAGNFLTINQPDGSTQYRILLTDGVNDAPINSVPVARQRINEDTVLTFSAANGNAISVSDADVHLALVPALNVTLTSTVGGNPSGTMSLSRTTGLTFFNGTTGTNESTISFRGSVADINAALAGLTFTPVQDYFNLLASEAMSANPVVITITTDDSDLGTPPQGQFSGVDTSVQTTTNTILVDVVDVNDPPSFNTPVNNPPATDEDGPAVVIPGFVQGMVAGPSPSEDGQTYAFSVQPPVVTSGNLQFVTGQEPAIDINGQLTYAVVGDTNGTATFTFTLTDLNTSDPGHVPASSTPVTVTITVNAINDKPLLTLSTTAISGTEDGGLQGPISLGASATAGPATATDEIAAPPAGQALTYHVSVPAVTVGNLAFDSFSINPVDGTVSYEATANTAGVATFNVWVEDSGSTTHVLDDNTSLMIPVTITVDPTPDPPIAVTVNYTIDQGDALLLDASGSSDPDTIYPGDTLTYSWDLNGDGTYDILNSASSTQSVPYATLESLGMSAPGSYTVGLQVTDTFDGTTVGTSGSLEILTVDYGSAPNSYGTLKGSNGAAHTIVSGFHLGATIDPDLDGQVGPQSDDDGVVFEAGMQADAVLELESFFVASASAAGKLDVWIDFDNSGTFEADEKLNGGNSYDVVAGDNTFTFPIAPGQAVTGVDTAARVRFSSAGDLTPVGRADDGEVEDYVVRFSTLLPPVAVESVLPMFAQTSDSTPLIQWQPVAGSPPGSNGRYNIELRNAANQVVGFEENHMGESITISDSLPPGVYTAFITPINRAGESLPPIALTPFEVVAITVATPSGLTVDNTPTVTWNGVEVTDHYQLQVRSSLTGTVLINETNLPGTSTTYDVGTPLDLGSYQVRVRAVESTTGQLGDWSPYRTFRIATAPEVTAPVTGTTVTTASPTVTWTQVPGAATYEVRLNGITDNVIPLRTVTGLTSTALTITPPLTLGEYSVQVRAIDAQTVAGEWSTVSSFTVGLVPVVSQPVGRLPDSTPTIGWTAVPGTDVYDVSIVNTTTSAEVYSATGLTGTQHTVPAADALPLGLYEVVVTARNLPAAGSTGTAISSASVASTFVVTTPPEILLPNVGIYDGTPDIQWTLPLGAVNSELEVIDTATGEIVFSRNDIAGDTVTVSGLNSLPLPPGGYRARVRSFADQAQTVASDWSTFHVFQIGSAPVPLGLSEGLVPAPIWSTLLSRPTLTWQQSLAGETFEVWLSDVTNQTVVTVQTGIPQASYTVTQDLPVGRYRYFVRADNGLGEKSAWSTGFAFDVKSRPVIAPIAPTFNPRPTFTWNTGNTQPEIDVYQVYIRRLDVSPNVNTVTEFTVTGNSFTPTEDLPNGRYIVWVRGRNNAVAGSVGTVDTLWSFGENFEIGGRPRVTTPGTTTDTTPLISWTPVGQASSYNLYVALESTPGNPVVNVSGLTATSFELTSALPNGDYVAWVRATSTTGAVSFWSVLSEGRFTVTGGTTGALGQVVVSPIPDSNDSTPTFSWTPNSQAQRYDLWVSLAATPSVPIIRETSITGTTFTSTRALAPGNYRVWVRAIAADNTNGPWSVPVNFTVLAAINGEKNETQPEMSITMLTSLESAAASLQADDVTVSQLPASVIEESPRQATSIQISVSDATGLLRQVTQSPRAPQAEAAIAADEADTMMADWDAAIWEEESAVVETADLQPPSATDRPAASQGWLAGLAAFSSTLLSRNRRKKSEQ